ncbi:FAD-binding oxidoreductase [soil metagenome]
MKTITPKENTVRLGVPSLNSAAALAQRSALADRAETPSLSTAAIELLRREVKGEIIRPTDGKYDEVRTIWNAMIDRRPALIVRCAEANDVPPALAFARRHGLQLSIRGGGHNIAGNALCEGGLLLDFSTMRKVRVDAEKRRAYVEPGALLSDLDEATQAHGLATPVGINSTTGIAGLTLGGGFGWLSRKHGLTIDNLVSVEVVTAEGRMLRASATENTDLFWALRGGGGNFAVVTEFEFQLHKVGPEIVAGLIVFPFDQAKEVLTRYREFVKSSPEELNVWGLLRKAPPLPFLPEEVHGREVVILVAFHVGDVAAGQKLIDPLLGFGTPHGTHVGAMPYQDWQKAFDPLLAGGARNYWKSHNLTELSDEALDTMIEFARQLPSPQCEIFIAQVAGAANRVAAEATAYRHRDAKFVLNVHGRWDDAAEDAAGMDWARAFFLASAPFASEGAYVNFMTEEEGGRVAAAYGANYERLARIKQEYDPENVFRFNQNIRPAR